MENISRIFESHKGEQNCERLTICEIHRRIFDKVIIALKDDPKSMMPIVRDLETAFLLGIKMNVRLCERRLDSIDELYQIAPDRRQSVELRAERKRLTDMITKQRGWLENHVDH